MSTMLKDKANNVFRDSRKTDMWLAELNPFFGDKTAQDFLDANPDQSNFVMLEMHMASIRDEYRPEKETQKQKMKRFTGLANHFFEDKAKAKKWLHSEGIPYMGYVKPVEHLKTDVGTRRVEQAFANMNYGFCA